MSVWCSGGVYNIITGAADDDPTAGQLIFYFMKGVAAVALRTDAKLLCMPEYCLVCMNE